MMTPSWTTLLLLTTVAVLRSDRCSASQKELLQRLRSVMKEGDYSHNQLSKIVSSYLNKAFPCLQTYTDESHFADSFLADLNQVDGIKPMILGVEWSAVTGCRGFVVIAQSYANARTMLKKLPRLSEHRILLIIKGNSYSLNEVFLAGNEVFLDADVVMVASGDLKTSYIMAQPTRTFSRNTKIKQWEYSDDGPKDFYGRKIQFLTYNCSMFSEIGPISTNNTPAWYRGAEVELMVDIAERLNLVPEFQAIARPRTKRTLWYEDKLNPLKPNYSDVAFCGILLSNKKMTKEVTMSVPVALLCLKFLVPRPVELSQEWDGVFQPFEPQLWFVITLLTLGIAFLLQRVTISTRKYAVTKRIEKYEGLGMSCMQTLSILLLADVPKSRLEQRAVRHLITWWAMFTLIITTAYSSGLITHLTRRGLSKTPDNIQQLLDWKYSWAGATTPDFNELFDTTNKIEAAWRFRFRLLKSRDDHVALLLRDKKQTLFGYEAFEGFTLPEYDQPDFVMDRFQVSSQCFIEYFIGFAMRDGSPFERPINKYIEAYSEAGLVKPLFRKAYYERREEHKYVFRVLQKTKGRLREPRGLKLRHLVGINIVWGLGVAISIVVFLLELAQKCWI